MQDSQIQGEMRKMTAFIKQEALEKSKEIHIKADEEFAIEKAKLVRTEQGKLDEQYAARQKKAGMSQQIAKSTVLNKQRLKVLAARQDVLDQIFDTAQQQLSSISQDKTQYKTLLEQLLLQGYLKLMSKDITISARAVDYDLVKQAIGKSVKQFKEMSGIDAEVSLDQDDPLPKSLHGGVIVKGNHGKIKVNNTLEERLDLMRISALPAVRIALFGASQTRKFHD